MGNYYYYVAVTASLYSSDCSVFGLVGEECTAMSAKFPSTRDVINGIVLKGSPIQVINSLSMLGYKVITCSGESELTWTLGREVDEIS